MLDLVGNLHILRWKRGSKAKSGLLQGAFPRPTHLSFIVLPRCSFLLFDCNFPSYSGCSTPCLLALLISSLIIQSFFFPPFMALPEDSPKHGAKSQPDSSYKSTRPIYSNPVISGTVAFIGSNLYIKIIVVISTQLAQAQVVPTQQIISP